MTETEGSHERDTTERDIMEERILARLTSLLCQTRQGDCPMHRSIAGRQLRAVLGAMELEGYRPRKVYGIEGESVDELLRAAGA